MYSEVVPDRNWNKMSPSSDPGARLQTVTVLWMLSILVGTTGASLPRQDESLRTTAHRSYTIPSKHQQQHAVQFAGQRRKSAASGDQDGRLPAHLVPISYNVKLLPFIDPGNFTFNGDVTISLLATGPGNNITVHMNEIQVKNESVEVRDTAETRRIGIVDCVYDSHNEFYVIMLQEQTQADHIYEVSISFIGNLNDKMAGFYRSSYTDEERNSRWLAVTQFEPTDARRAFPCFDEPALKATFIITLGRQEHMKAVSNMPIERTEPVAGMPGYVWDIFRPTVPMSTYLVAFLISDFDMMEAEHGASTTAFRLWSRNATIQQTDYARQIGPAILNYYEQFFKTEFPLPKQDMVAIPDFAAGAMENWGLITYRETALLYNPETSSASEKQRVAVVVSHELAHQWFGNLVTPSWWTDLWLNEGFATYVEYLGVDQVEPEWKMKEQFVTETVQLVMEKDVLESSHQISIPVRRPDEIHQLFDSISYDKGATLIRMTDHYLTTDTMRNGLANYLQTYKYQAADQDDLWAILTHQAHQEKRLPTSVTVKEIMDTWTLQTGYPVINVHRDYYSNSATVTQSRFIRNQTKNSENYLWWVPITFTYQSEPNFLETSPKTWIPKVRQIQMTGLPSADNWVIFNLQETAYYKVNYDQDNWNMILDQLMSDHTIIHTINRAQLIDDSLDLARSGLLNYETALSILIYLQDETEYLPWAAAFNNLAYINTQLRGTPAHETFKVFALELIDSHYNRNGFEDGDADEHLEQLARSDVLSFACSVKHPDCVRRCQKLFEQWMIQPTNETIIGANLRSLVYCTAIREGDEEEWNFTWRWYLHTTVAAERTRILAALGCTKQSWLLDRYLDQLLTPDSRVRSQDAALLFASVASNSAGKHLAWNFLRHHWESLNSKYGGSTFGLPQFVESLNGGFNDEHKLQQLEEFAAEHEAELGEARRAFAHVIEAARNDVAWMNTHYGTVVQWMQEHLE